MRCPEQEEKIWLYACGELGAQETAALELHLRECAGCAAALEEELRFQQAVMAAAPPQPSPALLAESRLALHQALDRAGAPGFWSRVLPGPAQTGWTSAYHGWLQAHPAWAAAGFIFLGVALGNLAPRLLQADPATAGVFQPSGAPEIVRAGEGRPWNVRGIQLTSSGAEGQPPVIEVEGFREQPLVFRGTLESPEIREALLFAVGNDAQFNADARLELVDVLKSRGNDGEVRGTLCRTARADRNPSVRLRALEALRGFEQDDRVRQTLLEALLNDSNAGVRIAAINALRGLTEKETVPLDPRILDVFRERMEKDPSTYIRVQSAAAVRQLAQRGVN
jgi:hypothetical protein